MLNWANEDVFGLDVQVATNQSFDTFTGASTTGFTATASTPPGQGGWDLGATIPNGGSITLTGTLTLTSGSPAFSLRDGVGGGGLLSNLVTLSSGGAFQITLTSNNSTASAIVVSDGDVCDFSISGLAITQNAYAATWYDQSGVLVESVFNDTDCSTANGWAQGGNTTLTVNYDSGDAGHESVFRAESGDGIADYIKLDDTYVDGTVYRLSFDHRYVTNSAVKGRIFVTGTQYGDITPSAIWARYELIWTQVGTGTSLRLFIDNNDGDASDEWLFDNIKVEVLDKLHNDAIQSTADSQPKVVDAGVLVTDANGNYSLDFDGVYDHLDVATISESQPITGFVVVDVENFGGDTSQDILDGTATDTNRILLDKSGSTWRVFAGASLQGPTLTTDVDLLYFLANGASSAIGLDGATPTTGDAGTNSGWASGLTIGTSISGGFLDGYLSAIIIYRTDQSANRSGIEQTLSKTITTALS